jgi:HK97 family phage major capsid protein
MDAEIKQKLEDLGKTVADFQAANNQRIEQLQKKGAEDTVTAEQVRKANEAIDGIKAEIKQLVDRSKEMETEMSRPNLGGDDSKNRDQIRQQALNWMNAKKTSDNPIENVTDEEVKHYQDYCKAFDKYLRYPENSHHVKRFSDTLSVGSSPDGGFWVPTQLQDTIVKRLFETSPIRQISDHLTISTADTEWPKDVNDATTGGWVGEPQARSDTDTSEVGMQKVAVHEQYAQPKVTQKFLDDAAINVEGWLVGKIADKLARDENSAFVTGNGVTRPRGFLSYGTGAVTTVDSSRAWGVLQYVPTGASAAFPLISGAVMASDANCLIDTVHSMKQAYRTGASWLMSRVTAGEVRKLRDENGRYLWIDSLILGQPDKLLNYPVVEAEDMPSIASNSLSIAFANMKLGYRVIDRMGIRILRDPFTDKPFVKFYTTKRVGGDVINFDAIKLMKFAAS